MKLENYINKISKIHPSDRRESLRGSTLSSEVFLLWFPLFVLLSTLLHDAPIWLPDLFSSLFLLEHIFFSLYFFLWLLFTHLSFLGSLTSFSEEKNWSRMKQFTVEGKEREREQGEPDSIWELLWWSHKKWDLWTMEDKNSYKADIHDLALC